MNSTTLSDLAAAVRDACFGAAIDAYEDAGIQGLCEQGRFEAAVGAIERVDLAAIVAAAGAVAGEASAAAPGAPRAPAPDTALPAPLLRRATREDLPAIVALLADDVLGAQRERPGLPLAPGYAQAFDAIERDPNCELLVACRDGRVVGTMQLDYTPGLSRQGAWRATIEAVRVASPERSRGTGRAMIEGAIDRAHARGCRIVQLSTDRSRVDAHRFYERLGFVASHLGMKLEVAARERPEAARAAPAGAA
jgi:GNAT superfamily N-acetyltransferase